MADFASSLLEKLQATSTPQAFLPPAPAAAASHARSPHILPSGCRKPSIIGPTFRHSPAPTGESPCHDANHTKIWDLKDMDADHVTAWSKGGGTMFIDILAPEEQAKKGEGIPVDTDHVAETKSWIVSGIYAFNRHRFSYRAAYNSRSMQRRTAGSWIVAARYTYGMTVMDPTDATLLLLTNGLGRFTTHQASVGAGYSFNWVPYHRDAVGPKDLRGLRNLTVNLTAAPMLTFYSKVIEEDYAHASLFTFKDEIDHRFVNLGRVYPNFIARAGICYSFGHFFVNAWGEYASFAFRSNPVEHAYETGNRYILSQNGVFSSWSVRLQLNYRF